MRLTGSLAVVVLGVLGSGCGRAARPAAPPLVVGDDAPGDGARTGDAVAAAAPALPPPPADLARAELVTLAGGTLTAFALTGGKVVELGTTVLAEVDAEDYTAHLRGAWADRDHLFVLRPERDVVVVTPAAITRVAVPPATAFKTPRPKVDDEGLEEGGVMELADATGLVVADGAAWWVECPWGYAYDGWQCEVWRKAQLWPQAQAAAVDGAVAPDRWAWADVKVSGFRTKAVDDDRGLGCTPPPGSRQKPTVFAGNADDGEEVHSHHWVSAAPPRLLVIYGQPGLADLVPSRWTLHDGCAPTPLAQGTEVAPGPDGLWLGDESPDLTADPVVTRRVLRRGADVLGELPHADVRFRPPAK